MSVPSQNHCLRCKTIELVALDSPSGISFFRCPKCQRDYAQKPGGDLHFRWLHPISLVLYPVIFKANPMEFFERIASNQGAPSPPKTKDMEFFEQIAAKRGAAKRRERTRLMVQEILLELEDPTQQVREILDCRASEEDLRQYLRCMADLMMTQLDGAKEGGE